MSEPECPECGGPLSLGGRFCKACGWDADLEESEDAHLDGIDLPETHLSGEDYDEFLGSERLAAPSGRRLFWIVVALVTLAAFLAAAL